MKKYLLLGLSVFSGFLSAQTFNYKFTHTTDSYVQLSGATSVNNGAAWDSQRFQIPIGFSFNYLGASFDSITFEPNGFIVFDKNRNYALAGFYGVTDKKENGTSQSPLSYQLSGTAGSRVLKIEYGNCLLASGSAHDTLNYQVWLHEGSGKIEIRTGPNTYFQSEGIQPEDMLQTLCGLVNMNNNSEPSSFFISGEADSPTATTIPMNGEFVYITGFPAPGKVFTFYSLTNGN